MSQLDTAMSRHAPSTRACYCTNRPCVCHRFADAIREFTSLMLDPNVSPAALYRHLLDLHTGSSVWGQTTDDSPHRLVPLWVPLSALDIMDVPEPPTPDSPVSVAQNNNPNTRNE